MDEGAEVLCPYCFQALWIAVDRMGGHHQRFVSDCEVCCRPIEFRACFDIDGRLELTAASENEVL